MFASDAQPGQLPAFDAGRNVQWFVRRVLNVIIDLPETPRYHRATIDAVRHAIDARNADVAVHVVRTRDVDAEFLAGPGDGVFIGPGSPYDVPLAADEVIRTARERRLPLVAT